jgi:hypothetical protein
MWIAKPLQSLSGAERAAWLGIQAEIPLSQTLAWGDAITALGGRAYLVFSPEEKVGGLVHSVRPENPGAFECINGPVLHWDDGSAIARQFATFVMAVARLSSAFSSLRVQPRWPLNLLSSRLGLLPIPPKETSQASTLQVAVRKTESERLASLSPRLRRSLSVARRAQVQVQSMSADIELISRFSKNMKAFGQKKGFFVPDESWLRALVLEKAGAHREGLSFFLTEAVAEGAETRLLTCVHGNTAHYLLGFDRRDEQVPSSLSTAASAHFHVLERCAELGVETYDLNGYTDTSPLAPLSNRDHPYSGVSRFKAQFRGERVEYASPVFVIEN